MFNSVKAFFNRDNGARPAASGVAQGYITTRGPEDDGPNVVMHFELTGIATQWLTLPFSPATAEEIATAIRAATGGPHKRDFTDLAGETLTIAASPDGSVYCTIYDQGDPIAIHWSRETAFDAIRALHAAIGDLATA